MFTADERRILTEAQALIRKSMVTGGDLTNYMDGYRAGHLAAEISAADRSLHKVLYWAERLDNTQAAA